MAISTKVVDSPRSHCGNFGTQQPPLTIQKLAGLWLTAEEAKGIYRQFQTSCIKNRQVLWSGMLRKTAQDWADERNFQTLTTALGPLLDTSHPESLYHQKSSAGKSRYMHGASVVFAWYISQGDLVTVLSQPPPQRFHPSGQTFYQTLEEPIVKGKLGNRAVHKIVVVHPTVGGAADFTYEMWPHDEPSLWTTTFRIQDIVVYWRQVKTRKPQRHTKIIETLPKSEAMVKQSFANEKEPYTIATEKKGKQKKKKKKKKKSDATDSNEVKKTIAASPTGSKKSA